MKVRPDRMRLRTAAALLCLLFPPALPAQDTTQTSRPAPQTLTVFLDCNTRCDTEYFREEIEFVSFVRDREVAQVHVLITGRRTGSGGTEYTLRFIGQGRFAGMTDDLHAFTSNGDTDDEEREAVTRVLKLGLVRYVARLPQAAWLNLEYAAPPEVADPQAPRDAWNYWVFEVGAHGYFSGESRARERFLSGEISASRVTDGSKFLLSLFARGSRNTFEIDSVTTVVGRSSRYNAFSLLVRSLDDHWSLGGTASATSSTSANLDWEVRAGPAIEFDIYPYRESTRRQITFLYQAGYSHADYAERTIFGKTREGRFSHSFIAAADVTQPWGNVNGQLELFSYLDDWSKNRVEVYGELEIRLFRGLELDIFASYERVRDQLNLPAGGATPEDILLELQELETSYRYEISAGLSYTFGSIFNNVVNPRFDPLD